MDPNLAAVAISAVVLVALVLGAVGAGWSMRGRVADAELALERRRVAELEGEVGELGAQKKDLAEADAGVVETERELGDARGAGDRGARRRGMLHAGPDDAGGAPPAPGGAPPGPDGGPRAAHGQLGGRPGA